MESMRIGNKTFKIGSQTYIVGILNITPDSFSDGGMFFDKKDALLRAREMALDGADIIEIGGESTRPGHSPVPADEELRRILPVIELVKKELDVPVSIDTMKSKTAEEAIRAGADMINDVSCLRHEPMLADVCAKTGAVLCIMHSRQDMRDTSYHSLLPDIASELERGIRTALERGVNKANIIIDPGLGFSKTVEQNKEILQELEFFTDMPYPLMLGASKKRFIGSLLGDLKTDERMEGTLAATVIGIMKGCDFIRVHDVRENKRAAMIADAVMRRSTVSVRESEGKIG